MVLGVECSVALLEELLTATSLSVAEADGAQGSLAAARWMIEMIGGTLSVRRDLPGLVVELAAAEAQGALANG